jgi:hypothetical protein
MLLFLLRGNTSKSIYRASKKHNLSRELKEKLNLTLKLKFKFYLQK